MKTAKMRKMNRKGDLPVTILVIGIFAICAFALLTFFISDFNASNSFVGTSVIAKVNSQGDEYLFYKNQGMDYETLKGIFNVTEEYGRSYLTGNRTDTEGGFLIFGGKKVLLFSVKYQVPS